MATWRRAWAQYDIQMTRWQDYIINNQLDREYFGEYYPYIYSFLEGSYYGKIDSWDGQWVFTCLANQGISIIPKVNLIKNLGYRADATHTKFESKLSQIPKRSLSFPLSYPSDLKTDLEFDRQVQAFCQSPNQLTFRQRLKYYLFNNKFMRKIR